MKFALLLTSLLLQLVVEGRSFPDASRLPGGFHSKTPFKTSGPYTIAHRGACGEFPESSAPAFKRAIEQGIDFLETDIGSTKDGVLVCLHDVYLDNITDVAARPEFADRRSTYLFGDAFVRAFFAVDFTLKELKSLRLYQRYSFRDTSHDGVYQILTFEEFISIALSANRVVGIDPEIKSPEFINKHVKWPKGKMFEDKYVEVLLKYGYGAPYQSAEWLKKPVFIQTFASTSILRIANQTKSPKIFNIGNATSIAPDTHQPYSELSTDEYLDFMGQYVVGISTHKNVAVPVGANGRLEPATDIVDRIHARGLMMHIATFQNEAQFMAKDFIADPYQEFAYFNEKMGVDAMMTDFPATLANYMKTAPRI